MRKIRNLRVVLGIALSCSPASCVPSPPEVAPPPAVVVADGPGRLFQWTTLDGNELSTAALQGRMSVIAFIATYDLASQAQARFLTALSRNHTPRINVAALVLERDENRPLVAAFVSTLRLTYPVAFADAATIAGNGPFAGLHHVPSVVILDPTGREVWRHVGLADEAELSRVLDRLNAERPSR